MNDLERAASVLANPAYTYRFPAADQAGDGYFEDDALSEEDALDSAVDVEMSRLHDGRYAFGVPVVPEVGAVLVSLGEVLDLVREALLAGHGVTVVPDIDVPPESPIAGQGDA